MESVRFSRISCFDMASSVIFVLAFLLVVANAAKIPPTWKLCKRSLPLPEYDKCIYPALQSVAGELTKIGAPTLGVLSLEPLTITALDIGQGNGPVALEIKFQDMKFGNLKTTIIDSIRHKDAENYKFGADLHLTKPLLVDAKYEINGKVLVLPIKGKGICHMELDNFRASYDLSGTPFKKGNEEYLRVENFSVKFDTDRLRMKFDNLFDGNKELGDNMNLFMNENWDGILNEVKPAIAEGMGAAFKAIANQIYSKIPYNQLMPA